MEKDPLFSSLADGRILPKDDPLFEALGDLDELSASIGMARAGIAANQNPGELPGEDRGRESVAAILKDAQRVLIRMGGDVASAPGSPSRGRFPPVSADDIAAIEAVLSRFPALRLEHFILAGGNPVSARIDLARTICRRAERRIVSLIRSAGRSDLSDDQAYLNVLSGYLFSAARAFDTRTEA
jgi:cob(I)alamin adenosyltransferase